MPLAHSLQLRLQKNFGRFLCYRAHSPERAMKRFSHLGLATLLLAATAQVLAFDVQELPSPPDTSVSWVGKNMVQNGMPMQVLQLRSGASVEELLRFYREDWRNFHEPGTRATLERDVGAWKMISTLVENHNIVVQLQRQGEQTVGFLSATPLDTPTRQNAIAQQFPRQNGTELMSSTESDDDGARATTLILQNSYSLQTNQAFYKEALQSDGWTLARSNLLSGTAVMLFGRSSGSIQLAMRREDNKTLIFANLRGDED